MNNSQWFAPPGTAGKQNVHFRARAAIEISEVPLHLPIKIAAENRYRLWCNGQEVATGPARGTSTQVYFDTLDLAPHLQSGRNELEVLVGCAGIPTFKYAAKRAALWIELEGHDADWQVAHDTSFDSAAPLYNWHTGFSEQRDLRVQDFDWQAPDYFSLNKQLLPRDCAALEVTTHHVPGITLPITTDANEPLVFDFKREIIGGAQLELEAEPGVKVDFIYGEHLKNGLLPIFADEMKLTFTDGFTTRAGKQVLGPSLQERGFRFLQIKSDAPIKIHQISAIDRRHPLPASNFHCEDERLNHLYAMAHHTVSSCSTDVITDCPWREQALWMNDMVVNAAFWLEVGGDPQLVARCLRLAFSEINEDGLIYGVTPNGEREEIVFLATNAFLPLMLWEVAKCDEKLAHSLLPQISEIMESLAKFGDADGLLVGPDKYWNFLDWSFEKAGWTPGNRPMASVNWFYVLALDVMAELSKQAGLDASLWQQRAQATGQALHKRFWDAGRGLYREFEDEEKASELAQALACLANQDSHITKSLSTKLAQDGDELFKPELYMMHFVLRALFENGYRNEIIARLHRYWGSIVDTDSPTLWEANVHQHGGDAFSGAGSLCHAFSCSPLWALPRLLPQS